AAVRALPCDTCVIDGEATIVDAKGKTSFQRLQNSIKTGTFDDLAFFAFDLLYLDGFDVTRAPLLERKAALRAMLPGAGDGALLRYSEHLDERGDRVLSNACDLGLEGIICKRADAPYAQTRSKTWLKVKC